MLSSKKHSLVRLCLMSLLAAMLLAAPTSSVLAVGLTYVDGDNGANTPSGNLSPLSNIANSDDPPATNDGLWSYRADGGVANPGDIFKSVFEASGGNNPEDAPEIAQTLSGLTPNTNYDVYVVYWQGAQAGHNWTVRAGYTSGNLALYNAKGPNANFPNATAGVNALYHDWTSALPTNPTDQQPMFFEADRTLLLGALGPQISDGSGNLVVYIDDLPTTGGADAGSSGARTWFEGLAYVPAGTNVYRAPGDFNGVNGIDDDDASTFLSNLHKDISSLNVLQGYQMGDLNADKKINHADFAIFKGLLNSQGGGSAGNSVFTGVPEPSPVVLLVIGGVLASLMLTRTTRQHSFACINKGSRSAARVACALAVFACLVHVAEAAPVVGWQHFNSSNGAATTKTLADAHTASPILGDGSNNGAGQIGLWADINGTVDGNADVALQNGQKIVLTGSVLIEGSVSSMEQFRWGLFNEASNDLTGWLGYFGHNSAGTGGGALRAKVNPNTDLFVANGTSVNLQTQQDGDAFSPGTYNFSMSVSRFGNDVSIDASLTGTGWLQEWKNVLTTNANQITYDFNRVGFLSGNAMSPDRLTFSNIDVSVAPADALTLQVVRAGPNAGLMQLMNNSGLSFDIDYYEITSVAGSLNTANWNSLDEQEGGDPPLQGWDEVPESYNSGGKLLSEVILEPDTFITVNPSNSFSLGNAFNVGGTEDLQFFVGLANGSLARGIVQYVDDLAVDFVGDYNDDGAVDAADYVMWRHAETDNTFDLQNDSATPGFQPADYDRWTANFGNMDGGGSASQSNTAVPEPNCVLLVLTGLLAMSLSRRTK